MSPEQWLQVKELFHAAAELAPAARAEYLRARCNGDASMLRELQLLLESHDEAEDFIERPAVAPASEIFSEGAGGFSRGRKIGHYSVLGPVGRGGMGVVLLAVRADDQFEKRVAIKLLPRGMDSEDLLRRFRNERQILASLEHPYIARLLDGGMTEDGLPYFVMEYIEGEPLDKYCQEHELSITQRLELFRTVCSAVQHAHQHLVVHRDLKPSNILVTAEGVPKLLDFGIAKLLHQDSPAPGAEATATLLQAMTPEYASPEQVRGRHITTASDIYSLGIILYELLVGQRPYKLKDSSPEEMLRVICDSEPTRPSEVEHVRRSQSAQPGIEDEREANLKSPILNLKSLKGDLDNIIMTALRKDPARRYKSVEQFSADVKRYLEGLPVTARKDTFTYRASKFITRNKVGVAAAAVVTLAIVAGLVATAWQARVARAERDHARDAQAKAERISAFLATALSYSDPSRALPGSKNRRDATINQMLDDVAPRIENELANQPEAKIALQRIVGSAYLSQLRIVDAERYLNAALDTQLKIYGEDHLETARILSALALVKVARGDWAGAEQTFQRAISIFRSQRQRGQQDIPSFAGALCNSGSIHWTRGDYNAAESAFNEALTLSSQLQGGSRELIADSKVGLGYVLYARGRLDEAVSLLGEAVGEYRALPHLRWKLSEALNPLGQVLTWRKEYDAALTVLRESEAVSREFFGEDNAYRARSLYLQAAALCFKGDYAEAAKTLDRTEEMYNRITPEEKINKANIYDVRNLILTRTGRAPEGETFARRAIEMYQGSINRGAASITLARINLAESLTAQKKYEEAERVLLEAYKDASEVQGTEHWRTKHVERELAALYKVWKKPAPEQK